MATFADCKGRKWEIDLTWGALQRLKREIGLDIETLVPKPSEASKEVSLQAFHDFVTDGERLFDAVWCACQSQAAALTPAVDKEGFGDGFDGSTFVAAADAFTQALIDFFPNHLRKALLRKVLSKGKAAMTAAAARLEREMDKIDVDKEVNANIDEALRKSSGVPLAQPT